MPEGHTLRWNVRQRGDCVFALVYEETEKAAQPPPVPTIDVPEVLDRPHPLVHATRKTLGRVQGAVDTRGRAEVIPSYVSRPLADRAIERYLSRPLAAAISRTVTDPDRLRTELEAIQARGYATADEELADGAVAIAAAIGHPGRPPVATLSVSAPKSRVGSELFTP
ncbi:IclR family transcriptional regulator domain-containing protein [Streptomyces sp. NPDC055140]